ncbi:uncharacterized protein DMAD_08882 [Drosophila madeirensis]|uniref:Uncharacterized protein n=1 Tax=Drosophila madeirensis TaxID=30013 RepID=A0AAU9F6X2_DROMD
MMAEKEGKDRQDVLFTARANSPPGRLRLMGDDNVESDDCKGQTGVTQSVDMQKGVTSQTHYRGDNDSPKETKKKLLKE